MTNLGKPEKQTFRLRYVTVILHTINRLGYCHSYVSVYLFMTRVHAHCPQGIILVGGLGTNSYLHQHLRSRYKPKGIGVLQSAGMKPFVTLLHTAKYAHS